MPKSKPFSRKILTLKSKSYFQCIPCDKIYKHELGLRLHKKKCPYSSKLSETSYDLTFKCICCGLRFNNIFQSKEHILKIPGGDYKVSTRR